MGVSRFGVSLIALGLTVAGAQAGGFSRGTADTDILYEDGNFNMRTGAIIVFSSQKFTSSPDSSVGDVVGTNYLGDYVIPSAAVKFRITDQLNCAGTYTDAFGADSEFAAPYGATMVLEESFTVAEFGATCAAFFPAGEFSVGKGRFAVLGGAFVEEFNYDLASVPMDIALSNRAYGWRAGVAYEIPDIAFRTEFMYRSGSDHTPEGTASTPLGTIAASASGRLPQSVELKMRSGIAPGWLAFGSVKWMDWSVNETFDLVTSVGSSQNEYYWRDGWTVTGGVAHSFNERVSGVAMLQWDRGVSTGYDLRGDKWLVSGGLSMKDSMGGELRLGGGAAYLEPVTITKGNNEGASVDTGWAGFLSLAYSVNW